jgi:hypothetical protein
MIDREKALNILATAEDLLSGDRAKTHGDNTFEHMARLASAYFDLVFTAEQMAVLMVLFKIARTIDGDKTHADHYVDAAAYCALAGALVNPRIPG